MARRTPGFTGADLANLINEAALLAARTSKTEIGMVELEEAIERVIAGPERKSRVMSEEERKLTAYHEGGHALVGYALPSLGSDPQGHHHPARSSRRLHAGAARGGPVLQPPK